MKISVFALLSSLLVLCGFGNAETSIASTGGVPTGTSQQIQDAATVPQGLNGVEWGSIRKQIAERQRVAIPLKGGYQAWNPGQQWRTTFDTKGFLVKPDNGDWSWGLELKRFGLAGRTKEVATTPRVTSAGSRVAYDWTDTVQEWFVNDTSGLEHGLTIGARPVGGGEQLELLFGVRGGLKPQVTADGKDVRFLNKVGVCVLTYSGLKVLDAGGKPVNAKFTAGSDGLRLQVADRGARYPLTIDPIAQQAYLKASNTGLSNYFGASVAVCADTVVVGSFNENSNVAGVNGDQTINNVNSGANASGAAYIFVRTGSSWSLQAYLKASNVDANDNFGISVAIFGDTVVVGASGESSKATGVNGNQSDNSVVNSGAAYLFVRSGTTWSQEAYLKASNTANNGRFGASVAISLNTVVVGASGDRSNATGVDGNQTNTLATGSGAA